MTEIPRQPDQSDQEQAVDPEQIVIERLGSLIGSVIEQCRSHIYPDPDTSDKERLVLYTNPEDPRQIVTIAGEEGMDPNGKFHIVYTAEGTRAWGSYWLLGMPGRRFAVIHPHPQNRRGRNQAQVSSSDLINDLMAAIGQGIPERPASPAEGK